MKNMIFSLISLTRREKSSNFQVLGDFKARRQDGRSRDDYIAILTKDLCAQYGYNEYLMTKFIQLFPNGNEVRIIHFFDLKVPF